MQTHMKMTGAWHLYEAGQRWRKPAHLARVVIGVEGWEAVCFSAPDVRTFVDGAVDDPTRHLGPDLCLADADLAAAVDRFAVAEASEAIAVALLDQRIACGVGNVFKSEVLFACGLSPFTPVGEVDVDIRRRLIETAHHQLRANLGSGPRRTVPEGLAVYGRERRPCRRCGVGIRRTRQGDHARSTYWCPRCQTGAD